MQCQLVCHHQLEVPLGLFPYVIAQDHGHLFGRCMLSCSRDSASWPGLQWLAADSRGLLWQFNKIKLLSCYCQTGTCERSWRSWSSASVWQGGCAGSAEHLPTQQVQSRC